MNTTGFTRKLKRFELVDEAKLDEIHKGTMEVLEQTGVTFNNKKALEFLDRNGCKVDYQSERVRFPEKLVNECINLAPSSFILKRRGEGNDILIGGDNVIMSTGCGLFTVDLDTWEARKPSRKEVYDTVTIIDALENCHMSGAYSPYWGYEGVPEVMAIPEGCAAKIRKTVKTGWEGCLNECEKFNVQMAKAAGLEIIGQVSTGSPLCWYNDSIETAFFFCDCGFPCKVGSGATMGASSPATVIGATILANAERLAMLTLMQLYKPGTRINIGNFLWPMNMRTGAALFGNIASSLQCGINEQMWHRYEVPTWHGAPGATNSKTIDFQCGYEKAIPAMLSSLYGGNILWFLGSIYGELAFHGVQAILDNEIAGMIGRFIQGLEVDDQTMAIDIIKQVGPVPGTYLDTDHTFTTWRQDLYMPRVTDSLSYDDWLVEGRKTSLDYAKERMEEILINHKPTPLSNGVDEELRGILKEAREYYRKIGKISDDEWNLYIEMLKDDEAF